MELTIIGIATAIVGLVLLPSSITMMLAFLMVCSLMGGAAAINLPALGGSSIPPAYFALVFLLGRLVLSGLQAPLGLAKPLRSNAFLILYVFYGVIGAFTFPKLFFGAFELTPMRITNLVNLFSVEPIHPSTQNITQAFYLVGTLLTGVATTIACRREGKADLLINTAILISLIHVMFGILDVVLYAAGHTEFLDFFRNGSYEQLSQDMGAFHRIAGIFPEASAYATYGFMMMVLMAELWLRNVKPLATGLTAGLLGMIIIGSTSSSGIVAISVYAPILIARLLIAQPRSVAVPKTLMLGCIFVVTFAGMLAIMIWRSDLADALGEAFQSLILGKATTLSGVQRAFWARQGLTAFTETYGLGIGPGSFRSSSLFTSVIGSVGAAGTAFFLLHCWRVLSPLRRATHELSVPETVGIGAAAAWASILGLIPAGVAGASPDPGFQFAVFSGIALAWSRMPQAAQARGTVRRTPARPMRQKQMAAPAPALGRNGAPLGRGRAQLGARPGRSRSSL